MATQIELQTLRKREFGEIIGDAFKIFFKNFKVYSFGFLVFVIPIFMLLGIAIISVGGDTLNKMMNNDIIGMAGDLGALVTGLGLLYAGLYLCYMSTYTLVYAGLKAYRENGDEEFSFDELKENFLKYIIPVSATFFLIMLVVIGAVFFPIFILGIISPALVFIAVLFIMPFVLYLAIITSLMPFIRVEEELSFIESYHRSKYLIKENWWSVFGVLFVAGLIAGLIAVVFNVPYLVFTTGAALGGIGGEEGIESVSLMVALSYLLGLIGSLFTSMYTQIALGLKYYDLVEKKDSTKLLDKIDTLGKSNDSFFENEGEY